MTVIAFDGEFVAADRMAVIGGGLSQPVTKIMRHGPAILAITGSWDTGAELRAWFIGGADPKEFPEAARKDEATLIVIDRYPGGAPRIASFASGPYPIVIERIQCAWGSGRDFALAAMHLGASAFKGVECAAHFQSDCGLGIDTLRLE